MARVGEQEVGREPKPPSPEVGGDTAQGPMAAWLALRAFVIEAAQAPDEAEIPNFCRQNLGRMLGARLQTLGASADPHEAAQQRALQTFMASTDRATGVRQALAVALVHEFTPELVQPAPLTSLLSEIILSAPEAQWGVVRLLAGRYARAEAGDALPPLTPEAVEQTLRLARIQDLAAVSQGASPRP